MKKIQTVPFDSVWFGLENYITKKRQSNKSIGVLKYD
jgi:hypothetical protein